MIEIVIAYDELDENLGNYFLSCKNDLLKTLEIESTKGESFNPYEITPQNYEINGFVNTPYDFKKSSFLMVVYSHGNESELIIDGKALVSTDHDINFFKDSFVYTNSCLSGKLLGPELIKNSCRAFIGYSESIIAFKNELQDVSVQCDNLGINLFLTNNLTAYEAYLKMKDLYTQNADKCRRFGSVLSAAFLIEAREALVFLGDKKLVKENLFV